MSILLPEGYQLLFKHTVDSTNTELKRLMQHGAPEHTVLCAIEQSAGRGRHGRSWESLNGTVFEPVRDALLSYFNLIPGNGAITCNGELHKGTYKTISPDGSLVFQTDTEELTVTSGEVFPEHSALCYS